MAHRRLLARRRRARGYTQETFAEQLGVERTTVVRWETGETEPHPGIRNTIREVLGVSVEELEGLLASNRHDSAANDEIRPFHSIEAYGLAHEGSTSEPISYSDIESIHRTMQQLLWIGARFGGGEASAQGLPFFRSMQRRIGAAPCVTHLQPDLYAAVGELAEVLGWFLYDADDQVGMRQLSHEALMYLQRAGDKSLELLTLQNLSMHAEYLRRPGEALAISERVLETERLSPRLESLFRARRAHSLAQQQRDLEARRELKLTETLIYDGAKDTDPAWAWWIDESQLNWFKAVVAVELDEPERAVESFTQARQTASLERVRAQYSYSVHLMEALILIGDWHELERVSLDLDPYIGEVSSDMTTNILASALKTIPANAPSNVHEVKEHLERAVNADGPRR